MKNIFFILFIVVATSYAYGSIENIALLKKIGIYTMAPSVLIYYLFKIKNITLFYVLALIFTFIADVSFHIDPNNILRETLTINSYIVVNALLSFIIIERNKFMGLTRSIIISIFLGLILVVLNYLAFKYSQKIILSSAVYFISLAILCALSISYYIRTKSHDSIYFLIAATSHIFASFAKGYEYLYNTPLSIIVAIFFYGICNYFYANAVILKNNKVTVNLN